MKKYISFFKIRFFCGLQYRLVMFSALTTQVFWGLLEVLAFLALWKSEPSGFPMDFSSVITYVWLKESLFALINTWAADDDTAAIFVNGGIAYEMCRPVSMYSMWFSRAMAGRLSEAALRCVPVLTVAILLPAPYGICFAKSIPAFFLFLLSMLLGLFVVLSFCILVYMLCFFTISPKGWRMVLTGAVELLSGSVIPLPFFPDNVRRVLDILPFASIHNVPFLIYTGELQGFAVLEKMLLQVFGIVVLVSLGELICSRAKRRVVVQGG